MLTDSKPGSLAEALCALQADLPTIAKSQTATVATRAGGSYSYRFCDLAQVTEAIMPRLGPLGLCWIAAPTLTEAGRFVLRYELRHISGESVGGEYPLVAGNSAQETGSSLTYARRYCLTSVTGVAPAEDDDGAAASARPTGRRNTRATASTKDTSGSREPEVAQNGARMISDTQSKKLHTLLGKAGHVERDQKLAFCRSIIGRDDLESSKGLTFREAALVLSALEQALSEDHDEGGPA